MIRAGVAMPRLCVMTCIGNCGGETMASRAEELLISADSHIIEDPHFWENRLPAAFKDQAPVFPEREVGGLFQAHAGGWGPHDRVKEVGGRGREWGRVGPEAQRRPRGKPVDRVAGAVLSGVQPLDPGVLLCRSRPP